MSSRNSIALLMLLVLMLARVCPESNAQTATEPDVDRRLPELFIIGDSTVKNRGKIEGWGDAIGPFFDAHRILIENDAVPGRSSRTFITEGLWEGVRAKLRKGDFVLMQFGHNDTKSPISMQRYSLAGTGEETEESTDAKTKQAIVIHTFGWYLRKMIDDTRAAGAEPIVVSPVPRNKWKDGNIVRGEAQHGPWAAEVAKAEGVPFVDINSSIADRYDPVGQTTIKKMFFPQDNTHTNPAGAQVNAACVILGLLQLKDCPLCGYLLPWAPSTAEDEAKIVPEREALPTTQP